jgi:hypothetical protein
MRRRARLEIVAGAWATASPTREKVKTVDAITAIAAARSARRAMAISSIIAVPSIASTAGNVLPARRAGYGR